MDLIEFIGFVITFFIFVVLMLKRSYERWKRYQFPDEEEGGGEPKDQEQQLKDFLKSLEEDMEEVKVERPLPPIPPKPKIIKPPPKAPVEKPKPPKPLKPVGALATSVDKRTLATKVDKRHLETRIEDRFAGTTVVSDHFQQAPEYDPYRLKKKGKEARIRKLLGGLKSTKDMVLLHEILSRPRSLR
jgi:hypothetical protein